VKRFFSAVDGPLEAGALAAGLAMAFAGTGFDTALAAGLAFAAFLDGLAISRISLSHT
jgi:hypothetical protein